ncbi:unnamed protein product, partial [Iphiclides podalirius]
MQFFQPVAQKNASCADPAERLWPAIFVSSPRSSGARDPIAMKLIWDHVGPIAMKLIWDHVGPIAIWDHVGPIAMKLIWDHVGPIAMKLIWDHVGPIAMKLIWDHVIIILLPFHLCHLSRMKVEGTLEMVLSSHLVFSRNSINVTET